MKLSTILASLLMLALSLLSTACTLQPQKSPQAFDLVCRVGSLWAVSDTREIELQDDFLQCRAEEVPTS